MTAKQQAIWRIIRQWINDNGRPPTVREVATAAGLRSPATAHGYLSRLADAGKIVRQGRSWRPQEIPVSVPLVGAVPAGSPLEIFATLGEEIEIPSWMAEKGGEVTAFRVRGESMKDAYIQEGDVVVIRLCRQAQNGDMVVAWLEEDGAITLKRLKICNDGFCLVPENPAYETIKAPFQLVGKVIGVLRSYR